ncbi:type I toxin-antitoxin system Ibs family toxin, partial [Escherichia coli]
VIILVILLVISFQAY